ncbi:MAG: hypothetical protein KGL39_11855 [Patescibacteria group bacterium]|nr:hypothetical protein [Patescibacteria group bacterium]
MTLATLTRDESYHALTGLGARQRSVVEALREHGPLSDRQLADLLGWPINRVVPRRNELSASGQLVEAGTVYDAQTGRNVTRWAVNSRRPFFEVVQQGRSPDGLDEPTSAGEQLAPAEAQLLAKLPHPAIWQWKFCSGPHEQPKAIPGWWPACPECQIEARK